MTESKANKNETTDAKKPAAPRDPADSESELSEGALEGVAGGTKPCASGEHYKKGIIIA